MIKIQLLEIDHLKILILMIIDSSGVDWQRYISNIID